MFRKPTILRSLSANSGGRRPARSSRVKTSRALCGTPKRSLRMTCCPRSKAASQARSMLRMAASCLVKSVEKLLGSRSYSSRARATARSMLAALFITTSSAIDPPLPQNVPQKFRSGLVEGGLFAENRGFIEIYVKVARPPAFAGRDDLVLQNRGGVSKAH